MFSARAWVFWALCSGALGSEVISGCEQRPCQNGGVCESHAGGFRCLCSPQSQNGQVFGGDTCETALSGCDGRRCENGGTCTPSLADGRHTRACSCPAGFAGPDCETSTVFSFEARGYVYVDTQQRGPEAPVNVTFSFRSDRPVGTLVQHRVDDLALSVELLDGRLCLRSLRGPGPSTLVQELPEYLSDSRWHRVEASLGGVVSFIRLICSEHNCTGVSAPEVRPREPPGVLPEPGDARQVLFVGPAGGSWGRDGDGRLPDFLGCFRDVLVDSQLVVPGGAPEGSGVQANVTAGCSDRDKCEEAPCENRGRCVSRGWRSYACECLRPHEGPNCAEEYVTARFGNKGLESYAEFSLDDDPGDTAAVSMFVRTRQPSGLLLVLANGTSQYLRLWLEEGRVRVQVHAFETLTGRAAVSDGQFHLVTLRLAATEAALIQSAQTQGSLRVRPIQARAGDRAFVGGLPDPRASATFGGYFKGCVQDLRINGKRLQFFPIAAPVESYRLEGLAGVARGCGGDDACAVNPCLNGGVCYPMWDDFICTCPPNTAGRRCQDVKWCELSPCPDTTACQSSALGFECLSNVTFRAESSVLPYRSNGKIERRLGGVSLSFRTRRSNATLLHAQRGSDRLAVSLLDSRLAVELRVGARQVALRSRGPLSDGEWHGAELRLDRTPPASCWVLVADGDEEGRSLPGASAGDLEFLKGGADIFLGGVGLDAGARFSGCLGPVEIGGLPLPFHPDTDLKLPRPQEEQFTMLDGAAAPHHGCWGAAVCAPDPCQHGGACEDLFDLHRCRCTPEWTGPECRESTDRCISGPCVHGNCSNAPGGGFECTCEPGHGGERCEVEADPCEHSQCVNGATCLKGLQSYSCLCPQNLTGRYCSEKVPDIPWYIEINPLPQLPVTSCRGARWNYSCFNGGNCSDPDGCVCLPGFAGHWCEKDVDECASDPCMNGGFCLNYVNRFECVCDLNHSGLHCQRDMSDFYLYVFLGLWQNLFQLMSYLVIRLDDEPEVDLGF